MTVYVDPPRDFTHKRKKYAHMMSDCTEELHEFAKLLGIKRHWFDRDHYDISPDQFHEAVMSGAKVVTTRDLVRLRQKCRAKN